MNHFGVTDFQRSGLNQVRQCLWQRYKLDGVGPVDNRPSTNKLHQFAEEEKKCGMWHITCDMWHVTRDMWHVTRDMWHVTNDMLGGGTFSQNFSSLALTFCDLWYYEDMEEKVDLLTDSVVLYCLKAFTGFRQVPNRGIDFQTGGWLCPAE
jgi:hypothetical protein